MHMNTCLSITMLQLLTYFIIAINYTYINPIAPRTHCLGCVNGVALLPTWIGYQGFPTNNSISSKCCCRSNIKWFKIYTTIIKSLASYTDLLKQFSCYQVALVVFVSHQHIKITRAGPSRFRFMLVIVHRITRAGPSCFRFITDHFTISCATKPTTARGTAIIGYSIKTDFIRNHKASTSLVRFPGCIYYTERRTSRTYGWQKWMEHMSPVETGAFHSEYVEKGNNKICKVQTSHCKSV